MSVSDDTIAPPSAKRDALVAERVVVTGLWAQFTALLMILLFSGSPWVFAASAVLLTAGVTAATAFVSPKDPVRRAAQASALGLVVASVVAAAYSSEETYRTLRILLWAPVVAVVAWEAVLWRDRLTGSVEEVAARWERLRSRSVLLGHVLVIGAAIALAVGTDNRGGGAAALGVALIAAGLFLLVWLLDALGVLALTSRAAPASARPAAAMRVLLAVFVLSSLVGGSWMGPAGGTSRSRTLVQFRSVTCQLEYDPPLFPPRASTVALSVDDGGYSSRIGPFDVDLALTDDGGHVYFERKIGTRGFGSAGAGLGEYGFRQQALGFGTLTGRCDPA